VEAFEVKGVNGQLRVTPHTVTIARKGALGFLTGGHRGEKEIRLDQISAVQFKAAGWATNGYIQFAFMGGSESKGGALDAAKDENAVMFSRKQEAEFRRAKELIDQYRFKT
jgi:hypothetical protein